MSNIVNNGSTLNFRRARALQKHRAYKLVTKDTPRARSPPPLNSQSMRS